MGNLSSFGWSLLFFLPLLCGAMSCNKPAHHPASEEVIPAQDEADEAVTAVDPQVEKDLAIAFCANVGALKLRVEASQEIAFFCKGKSPSVEMQKLRKSVLEDQTKRPEPVLLQAEHDPETKLSQFLLAWGFSVPASLIELRDKKLYEFIAQGFQTDSLEMQASSQLRADDPLDGGLHIYSVDLNYDLMIHGPQGLDLKSQRSTQYNLYQVKAGDEDLGLGIEHLLSSEGGGYTHSTMINVSMSDGKGGTIVLTLLHFAINNQGFSATATRSIQDIAKHLSETMYTGLSH